MRIVIDSIPKSLNAYAGRRNSWEYRKDKAEWKRLVWAVCRATGQVPKKPFAKALVRIDYFFKDRRRHDPDNYAGKMLLDGLTAAGVLADDDFGHIFLVLHGHVDAKRPRTEVTVVDLGGLQDGVV